MKADDIAVWIGYAALLIFNVRSLLATFVFIADAIDMADGQADWPWIRKVAGAVEWLDSLLDVLPVKRLGRQP